MLDYHYGILLSMIISIMMNDDIITIMIWLVVWNHGILWLSKKNGNFIIPTDELIFFRGVGIPPTRFYNFDI